MTSSQLPQLHQLGLDYRTCGVARLEQLYDTPGLTVTLPTTVLSVPGVTSVSVLQTCNRLEVYFCSPDGDPTPVREAVAALLDEPVDRLCAASGPAAVGHLFRVAAGLESMVVGEDQILAQVRTMTVEHGTQSGAADLLAVAVEHAIRLGKRIRTETAINSAGRSTASAGLDLLSAGGAVVRDGRALILGAGAMGAVVAKALRDRSVGALTIANRDLGRAERLAERYDARAVGLDFALDSIAGFDLVVCCLGLGSVLSPSHFASADHTIGVLDLGVPRNVGPDTRRLPVVQLVNLEVVAEQHDGVAQTALVEAQALVTGAVAEFEAATATQLIGPTILQFRATASAALAGELARLDVKTPDLDPRVRAELHKSMRRVVEKVLHQPTVRAKRLVSEPGGHEHVSVIEQLLATH